MSVKYCIGRRTQDGVVRHGKSIYGSEQEAQDWVDFFTKQEKWGTVYWVEPVPADDSATTKETA